MDVPRFRRGTHQALTVHTAQSTQTTHLCSCPSQKSPRKSISIFHFGSLSVKRNYLFYFVVHDPCAIFLCHSFIGDKEIPTTNNNKYSFLWIKSDMRAHRHPFFIVRLFGVGCFIHLNIVVPLLRQCSTICLHRCLLEAVCARKVSGENVVSHNVNIPI